MRPLFPLFPQDLLILRFILTLLLFNLLPLSQRIICITRIILLLFQQIIMQIKWVILFHNRILLMTLWMSVVKINITNKLLRMILQHFLFLFLCLCVLQELNESFLIWMVMVCVFLLFRWTLKIEINLACVLIEDGRSLLRREILQLADDLKHRSTYNQNAIRKHTEFHKVHFDLWPKILLYTFHSSFGEIWLLHKHIQHV